MWVFIAPLFRFSFWFSTATAPFSPVFDALMLWGNVAFIVVSIGLLVFLSRTRTLAKDLRRFFYRVTAFCFWCGLAGLMLYLMNWLRVPILGMRFIVLCWIVPFAWWAIKLALYYFRERPKAMAASVERHAYEKWLPRPNKR